MKKKKKKEEEEDMEGKKPVHLRTFTAGILSLVYTLGIAGHKKLGAPDDPRVFFCPFHLSFTKTEKCVSF